ncbi:Ferredoxin--NADP reductase [Burkholderiales bacterium]|nr:Ferredoxin--NADP reductase [Burkholderiales bacterium]
MDASLLAWYLAPAAALMLYYALRRRRAESAHARELAAAVAAGMTEPPSLHPVVDPLRCIGSATCVRACPEKALGIVDGRATLVSPASCIGHGACEASCPVRAIELVFGTERRGIDIPRVDPNFETNVPGVFIAGELGGMGLIRKASEQGRQAIRTIASRPRRHGALDVLIVGAGPAGIAAGLAAIEAKLRYRLIEQEPDLGGSVFHYPRHKIAMTQPVELPIVGTMRFTEVSKEALLAFWRRIVSGTGLAIHFSERFERMERIDGGFRVVTGRGTCEAAHVLLAIGRRGTPRKLGVEGEERAKVVYRLVDAAQYRGLHVLVVGGGDSAVEAALACADEAGTAVTLAYRGDAFSRAKPANRERLDAAARAGRVDVRLRTDVSAIGESDVTLAGPQGEARLPNDRVIVQAGGVLPTELLRSLGVDVETKFGSA